MLTSLKLRIINTRNDGLEIHVEEYPQHLFVMLVAKDGAIIDRGEIDRRNLYEWIMRRQDY